MGEERPVEALEVVARDRLDLVERVRVTADRPLP
jgi:hypothetical protein